MPTKSPGCHLSFYPSQHISISSPNNLKLFLFNRSAIERYQIKIEKEGKRNRPAAWLTQKREWKRKKKKKCLGGEREGTVAPKLSRNIPGAPGSGVSVAEGVRRRMRRSRGSLSPRQSWPGLSSLGNQLDFPCTSHPARPGERSHQPFPNGCSLGCLTGCHESKTYGGCNPGSRDSSRSG